MKELGLFILFIFLVVWGVFHGCLELVGTIFDFNPTWYQSLGIMVILNYFRK